MPRLGICQPIAPTIILLKSKIKAFIRKVGARTQELLYKAIADALATITQSDVHGWFKSCGYDIL